MNRVFEPCSYFTVRDGTDVSAFLNANDVNQSDLPYGSLSGFSIAAGRIGAHKRSWIHMHPVVTQVTYVVSGNLVFRMKGPEDSNTYPLQTKAGQAVVTRPGRLFQLQNGHVCSQISANERSLGSPSASEANCYVFVPLDRVASCDDYISSPSESARRVMPASANAHNVLSCLLYDLRQFV